MSFLEIREMLVSACAISIKAELSIVVQTATQPVGTLRKVVYLIKSFWSIAHGSAFIYVITYVVGIR